MWFDSVSVVILLTLFPFLSHLFFSLLPVAQAASLVYAQTGNGVTELSSVTHYPSHSLLSVICLLLRCSPWKSENPHDTELFLPDIYWEKQAWRDYFFFLLSWTHSATVQSVGLKAPTTYQTLVCEWQNLWATVEQCQMPVWLKMLLGSTYSFLLHFNPEFSLYCIMRHCILDHKKKKEQGARIETDKYSWA